MEFTAFYNHGLHGKAMTALWYATMMSIEGRINRLNSRHAWSASRAYNKCLMIWRMAGGEVHIRTCEPSIACVCIACHECSCASRAEFVSGCWSKQNMYIAGINQMDC